MKNKCLYCYKELNGEIDFHQTCSFQFFGVKVPPQLPYLIDEMHELAKHVVERRVSVPGVQSKLSMSVVKEKVQSRLTVVDALGGNYILKPPTIQYPEMPENEHLTMRLAELCGIKVVSSALIRLKSGELSYITKRIDRTNSGDKIHMLDMFQITEAVDKYKSSMEKVGKAIDKCSANTLLDKLILFEITVFSYLTGNNDMHLKNFSMINENDQWVLAPAYDLLNVSILLPEDKEELALSLEGKKSRFSKNHFESFGKNLGLNQKQIAGVFFRFEQKINEMIELIQNSFLSSDLQEKYISLLKARMKIVKC
ncbi:MAG: HipA domain-containing protein [Flavobacteriales bacterium]|nr:HipA domain-containing protein [Flavobacteriales bacterium]